MRGSKFIPIYVGSRPIYVGCPAARRAATAGRRKPHYPLWAMLRWKPGLTGGRSTAQKARRLVVKKLEKIQVDMVEGKEESYIEGLEMILAE